MWVAIFPYRRQTILLHLTLSEKCATRVNFSIAPSPYSAATNVRLIWQVLYVAERVLHAGVPLFFADTYVDREVLATKRYFFPTANFVMYSRRRSVRGRMLVFAGAKRRRKQRRGMKEGCLNLLLFRNVFSKEWIKSVLRAISSMPLTENFLEFRQMNIILAYFRYSTSGNCRCEMPVEIYEIWKHSAILYYTVLWFINATSDVNLFL